MDPSPCLKTIHPFFFNFFPFWLFSNIFGEKNYCHFSKFEDFKLNQMKIVLYYMFFLFKEKVIKF